MDPCFEQFFFFSFSILFFLFFSFFCDDLLHWSECVDTQTGQMAHNWEKYGNFVGIAVL